MPKLKLDVMQNNLKQVLKEKGISAYKMGKDIGVTLPTIYSWVKSNNLSPDKMKICSDYLGVETNELFKL